MSRRRAEIRATSPVVLDCTRGGAGVRVCTACGAELPMPAWRGPFAFVAALDRFIAAHRGCRPAEERT